MCLEVIDADSIVGGQVPPLKILPFGETGELCITGPGVAAGYLGRPELTAEKFLPNPWARNDCEARLYRTGDLARVELRADGQPQMQCLGRADDQVKVRGFRVELGEIEAVLAAQPGVGTTAVVLRPDAGMDQLIAFYVPNGQPPEAKTLRAALADRLPPYMVPARFEDLAAMPRLSSGKIDRKVLKSQPLAPAAPAEGGDEPETPAETALFAALQGLFPGQPLRRAQDFFSDLGGHSLLAARLVSRLRQDACFARATVADIYTHRRLGAIAQALQAGMVDARAGAAERPFLIHGRWRRWRCGLAQGLAIPLLVLLNMAQWLAPFFAYHFYTGDAGDSITRAVAMSVLAFGQHAAGLWRGHHGALAAGRPPGTGQLPAVGPDLLPLVAGRSANRDRARVPAQRLGAVPGLAAPAGRAHRARGGAGFHHHARAAPGQHWRGHQHRQRRKSGKCPRRRRPAAPGSHRHWRQRLHRLLRGHRRRHGGR